MPCQDYPSNGWEAPEDSYAYRRLKERADMLARIACKAMGELERQGTEDFILLKDEEIREWWAKHKEDDRKAAEQRALKRKAAEEKAEKARLRRDALAKLSAEERKVLGIK